MHDGGVVPGAARVVAGVDVDAGYGQALAVRARQPVTTSKFLIPLSTTQCAAVTTAVAETTVAPQNWPCGPVRPAATRKAVHGAASTVAPTPPTMRAGRDAADAAAARTVVAHRATARRRGTTVRGFTRGHGRPRTLAPS
jgi:hypothetical protein